MSAHPFINVITAQISLDHTTVAAEMAITTLLLQTLAMVRREKTEHNIIKLSRKKFIMTEFLMKLLMMPNSLLIIDKYM